MPRACNKVGRTIIDSYWLFRVLGRIGWNSTAGICLASTGISVVWLSALVLNASWEGTLFLDTRVGGRGLLEHYGTLSLLIGFPVISTITAIICSRIEQLLYSGSKLIPNVHGTESNTAKSQREVDDLLVIMKCSGSKNKSTLILMVFIGVCMLTLNIQNTRHAIEVYGNDVWDSSNHPIGYVVGKFHLAFLWIVVFPTVGYIALGAWHTVRRLANMSVRTIIVTSEVYAVDKCAGLQPLGSAMMLLVYLIIPFSAIIMAHVHTHTNLYFSLWIAVGLTTLFVFAILLLPFIQVHKVLISIKCQWETKTIQVLNRLLRHCIAESPTQEIPEVGALIRFLAVTQILEDVRNMNTWPYVKSDVIKMLSPFLPILLTSTLKLLGK
jgi:hypothetical protein